MIQQTEFRLSAKRRGCHLVTREILDNLPMPLPKAGLLNLGTWQGIYLCEFRDYGGARKIVATIYE